MCQKVPPSSPTCSHCSCPDHSPYLPSTKVHQEPHMLTVPLIPSAPTKHHDNKLQREDQEQQQNPSYKSKTHLSLAILEARKIANIALPMVLTGLILYSRSMVSMLFLGRLGELALAGGSLAIGFANITGYSVLSGLATGMEPICGQAFGAKRYKVLGLTLQRTVLLLLLISIPISILWLNMRKILIFCGQDEEIATEAQSYILYSLPDLLIQSFLHPLRIYLRTQSITLPLTCCAALAMFLHVPINYFLVSFLNLGAKGVALSAVWTNFCLVIALIAYIAISGISTNTWCAISTECLKGWKTLSSLAIPSCISVCLEWWWYEIMILLCGLLPNPKSTVASMGILIQTTSLIYIFPSSLSSGVSTRVGNELGAGNPKRAKLAAMAGLVGSFVLGASSLAFAVSVRGFWAKMFSADAQIVALTAMVLPIVGLCEMGNCPQTVGCGAVRGTARPEVGARVNLWSFYGVGAPVGVGLGFFGGLGFRGLWMGMAAAQGSCVLAMMAVLGRTDWEGMAERAKEITGGGASTDFLEDDKNYKDEKNYWCA